MPDSKSSPLSFSLDLALSGKGAVPRTDYDKALALLDSEISDEAAKYTLEKIGDGPANTTPFQQESDEVLQHLGIPRNVDAFLKSGIFQLRLKDKEKIVNAWTEIRAGL